jgi:hypothetical protein
VNAAVDLYWLPLGAGGHSVRLNGRVFELLVALRYRRTALDLYHSALEVSVDGSRYTIEMTPAGRDEASSRGVAFEAPVGSRRLMRWRWFRYEVRCWRDGTIPDVAEAVASPRRVSGESAVARRLLALVPRVPSAIWGRDELQAGEMWNSNSIVSWLLVMSGVDVTTVAPPEGGRAPGWDAGVVADRRSTAPRPRPIRSLPRYEAADP